MDLEVGSILDGKVTGITKFGAFVTVAPGKSGLVHISEIANTYVNDVHEYLTEGQEVKVKVIAIDPNGRINLSIRQLQAPASGDRERSPRPRPAQSGQTGQSAPAPRRAPAPQQPPQPATFEDKLKRFMHDSDTKLAASKQYAEKRSNRRRNDRSYRDFDDEL